MAALRHIPGQGGQCGWLVQRLGTEAGVTEGWRKTVSIAGVDQVLP
jgi:hypothetical protein